MRVLLSLLILAISAFAVDPVVGMWKSVNESRKETGFWTIYEKDFKLYGELILMIGADESSVCKNCDDYYENFPYDTRGKQIPLIGTPFIYGLKLVHQGSWSDGYLIDPDTGKVYECNIDYIPPSNGAPSQLKVRGESTGGLFSKLRGKNQFWQSVSVDDLAKAREENAKILKERSQKEQELMRQAKNTDKAPQPRPMSRKASAKNSIF